MFADIAMLDDDFPVIIGLAEVENRGVAEDIAASERLASAGYRVVHFDSPDERGIDVAFCIVPSVSGSSGVARCGPMCRSYPIFGRAIF